MPIETKLTSAWKLGKAGRLEGERSKVKAAIASQADLPAHVQSFLIASIDARPESHNWVTLDAHCQRTTQDDIGTWHLRTSAELI